MKSYPVLALKSTFFSGKLLKSGFLEEGGVPPRGGGHVITQMRQSSDVSLYFPDLSPMPRFTKRSWLGHFFKVSLALGIQSLFGITLAQQTTDNAKIG